jgi:hypothetical protein
VKVAASWTTPSPFSFYTNAGVGSTTDGVTQGSRAWASLANWYAVSPRVSLLAEGMAGRTLGGPDAMANDVDAGVTWLLGPQFQLDARAGIAVGPMAHGERFFGFGFARRW